MKRTKLLDAFALIKFFNDESGSQLVESILSEAQRGDAKLYITEVNVGEIYYIIAKQSGQGKAEEILSLMRTLPIQWLSFKWDQTLSAARLKSQYPLSYADCFALAAAIEYQAELVTGDPEFEAVAHLVRIQWI